MTPARQLGSRRLRARRDENLAHLPGAALSFVLLYSGCSAMSLGDFDLTCKASPRAGALDTYVDPCGALNAEHGLDLATDCQVYQCRADGKGCEKRPQDLDQDGSPNEEVCKDERALSGQPLDCADGDAQRFPGNEEGCDGVDNDCDGLIDDGDAQQLWSAAFTQSEQLSGPAASLRGSTHGGGALLTLTHDVVGAPEELATDLWLLARESSERRVLAAEREDYRLSTVASVLLDDDTLFMAAISTRGCGKGRLALAVAAVRDLPQRRNPDPANEEPLPWQGLGEECTEAGASAPQLSLEPDGSGVLVAWLSDGALRAQRVALDGRGQPQLPGENLPPLGRASGSSLAMVGAGGGERSGALLAYASAPQDDCAGGLSLLFLETPTLLTRRRCLPLKQVQQVALSAHGGEDLALAARSANGLDFFALTLDADGTPSELAHESLTQAAMAGPSIAYAAEGFGQLPGAEHAGGWLVTWTSGSSLHGQRIARQTHAALGEPFVLYADALPTHALSLGDATYGLRLAITTDSQQGTLYIGTASCGGP